MKKILFILAIFITATLLVSCSSDSAGAGTEAISAAATIENADKVKEIVAKNQKEQYDIFAITQKINTTSTRNFNMRNYTLKQSFSTNEACSGGGSIDYTYAGTEENPEIAISYNNCTESDIFMNGKVFTIASGYNEIYGNHTNFDITFTSDMIVQDSESKIDINILSSANVKMLFTNVTAYNEADNLKMTLNLTADINGLTQRQEDSIYYFDLSSNEESMYQTAGRIYIDELASYVDYATDYNMTKTPFIFSGDASLIDGEARYTMADGSQLKIVVEDAQAVSYIDVDGDGVYELSEF